MPGSASPERSLPEYLRVPDRRETRARRRMLSRLPSPPSRQPKQAGDTHSPKNRPPAILRDEHARAERPYGWSELKSSSHHAIRQSSILRWDVLGNYLRGARKGDRLTDAEK